MQIEMLKKFIKEKKFYVTDEYNTTLLSSALKHNMKLENEDWNYLVINCNLSLPDELMNISLFYALESKSNLSEEHWSYLVRNTNFAIQNNYGETALSILMKKNSKVSEEIKEYIIKNSDVNSLIIGQDNLLTFIVKHDIKLSEKMLTSIIEKTHNYTFNYNPSIANLIIKNEYKLSLENWQTVLSKTKVEKIDVVKLATSSIDENIKDLIVEKIESDKAKRKIKEKASFIHNLLNKTKEKIGLKI